MCPDRAVSKNVVWHGEASSRRSAFASQAVGLPACALPRQLRSFGPSSVQQAKQHGGNEAAANIEPIELQDDEEEEPTWALNVEPVLVLGVGPWIDIPSTSSFSRSYTSPPCTRQGSFILTSITRARFTTLLAKARQIHSQIQHSGKLRLRQHSKHQASHLSVTLIPPALSCLPCPGVVLCRAQDGNTNCDGSARTRTNHITAFSLLLSRYSSPSGSFAGVSAIPSYQLPHLYIPLSIPRTPAFGVDHHESSFAKPRSRLHIGTSDELTTTFKSIDQLNGQSGIAFSHSRQRAANESFTPFAPLHPTKALREIDQRVQIDGPVLGPRTSYPNEKGMRWRQRARRSKCGREHDDERTHRSQHKSATRFLPFSPHPQEARTMTTYRIRAAFKVQQSTCKQAHEERLRRRTTGN
ncbi:hypothetical protein BKA70DRAFT_1402741 [Coprinopsis sp. MPI-PUGE-AT-0042]|nr:hypothetical protein BKA70DRAFT_1402741 [Coprinopsis sp. MPI-PUGE-AT-0042]